MADTLHAFMKERAQSDTQALRMLQTGTRNYLDAAKIIELAEQRRDGKATDIRLPRSFIENSMIIGMARTGESVKDIERKHPELIQQYPDIPWIALKRLRDHFSHPSRHLLSNAPQAEQEKFNREFSKLMNGFDAIKDATKQIPDDPVIRAFLKDAGFIYAMGRLLADNPNEAFIPMTDTVAVKDCCQFMGIAEDSLLFVIGHNQHRLSLNSMADAIEHTSLVSRKLQGAIVTEKIVGNLLRLRDPIAHFNDQAVLDTGDRPADVFRRLVPQAEYLRKAVDIQLGDRDDARNGEETLAYNTYIYHCQVVGPMYGTPKAERLDQFVATITSLPKLSVQQQEAYIVEAAQLLREKPVEVAEGILGYIEGKGSQLRNPQQCLNELNASDIASHVILQRYFGHVQKWLQPLGENRGLATLQ